MRITCTGGFNHDVGVYTQTLLDQMMVHGAGCQQAMDRQGRSIDGTIGQHQNGRAVAHSQLCHSHNIFYCLLQAFLFRLVGAIDVFNHKARAIQLHQGGEFTLGQYRR